MMNILITGGAGFVGANLAVYFAKKGHNVISMDNLVRRGSEFSIPRLIKAGVKFLHGDIRNKEDFYHLPKDINFILNTAAETTATDGYLNPEYALQNNTIGMINILEFARKHNSSVIQWSTNKVYSGDRLNAIKTVEKADRFDYDDEQYEHGVPEDFPVEGGEHSVYGISKLMSDLMCQEYHHAFKVKTVANRFSCLCGPYQWSKITQGWYTWWAMGFYFKQPMQYIGFKGKQVRDVLYIDDVAKLIELEMDNMNKISGEVFNVGGGPKFTISLRQATKLLEDSMGYSVPIETLPTPRRADQRVYISDIRKVMKALSWKPMISPKEAFERIIEWIKKDEATIKQLPHFMSKT